jgi:hypothetical protein
MGRVNTTVGYISRIFRVSRSTSLRYNVVGFSMRPLQRYAVASGSVARPPWQSAIYADATCAEEDLIAERMWS